MSPVAYKVPTVYARNSVSLTLIARKAQGCRERETHPNALFTTEFSLFCEGKVGNRRYIGLRAKSVGLL
jgi:hypothetical protein